MRILVLTGLAAVGMNVAQARPPNPVYVEFAQRVTDFEQMAARRYEVRGYGEYRPELLDQWNFGGDPCLVSFLEGLKTAPFPVYSDDPKINRARYFKVTLIDLTGQTFVEIRQMSRELTAPMLTPPMPEMIGIYGYGGCHPKKILRDLVDHYRQR